MAGRALHRWMDSYCMIHDIERRTITLALEQGNWTTVLYCTNIVTFILFIALECTVFIELKESAICASWTLQTSSLPTLFYWLSDHAHEVWKAQLRRKSKLAVSISCVLCFRIFLKHLVETQLLYARYFWTGLWSLHNIFLCQLKFWHRWSLGYCPDRSLSFLRGQSVELSRTVQVLQGESPSPEANVIWVTS